MLVLLDDLADYVQRTGHTILVADDPMTRSFGFADLESEDPQPGWTISLTAAQRSLNEEPRDERKMMIWDALRTTAGRQALASAISRVGSLNAALPRLATETVIDPVQAALEPPVREAMPTAPDRPARTVEERLRDDDLLPP
jgi:hypothetical protein